MQGGAGDRDRQEAETDEVRREESVSGKRGAAAEIVSGGEDGNRGGQPPRRGDGEIGGDDRPTGGAADPPSVCPLRALLARGR